MNPMHTNTTGLITTKANRATKISNARLQLSNPRRKVRVKLPPNQKSNAYAL